MVTALDAAYFDIQIERDLTSLPSVYKTSEASARVSAMLVF